MGQAVYHSQVRFEGGEGQCESDCAAVNVDWVWMDVTLVACTVTKWLNESDRTNQSSEESTATGVMNHEVGWKRKRVH